MVEINSETEHFVSVAPGYAARLIGWMFLGALLLLGVSLLLPIDPYLRFQQADGTMLFRVRWIYERIHFDPTPIDVAMIGSSRMEASVRAEEVSRILTEKLERPVHVVNFGVLIEGRDLQWTIADELLRNRSEVRLIVLSVGQEAQLTHPAFRFLGDDLSIATSPVFFNASYAENLLTIPYRHIAYFVQAACPWAFGVSPTFDLSIYRARSFDPTESYFIGDIFVDRDRKFDPAVANAQRGPIAPRADGTVLARLPLDQRFPIEREFVRRIAALAKQKGVEVAFLQVPLYLEKERFSDLSFYTDIGPVLKPPDFGTDSRDYTDIPHLSRRGSEKLTPWLADQINRLLMAQEKR